MVCSSLRPGGSQALFQDFAAVQCTQDVVFCAETLPNNTRLPWQGSPSSIRNDQVSARRDIFRGRCQALMHACMHGSVDAAGCASACSCVQLQNALRSELSCLCMSDSRKRRMVLHYVKMARAPRGRCRQHGACSGTLSPRSHAAPPPAAAATHPCGRAACAARALTPRSRSGCPGRRTPPEWRLRSRAAYLGTALSRPLKKSA